MADYQKTVDIIFGGRDKASPVVKSLSNNLNQLDTAVQGVARPLGNLADKTLSATAALTALGGVVLGLSINEAQKFQSAFGEISTLFDANSDNVEQFKDDILDYSKNSTQAIQDINAAVYSAISAGASYQDSLALLNQTEKLAVGGKTDLNSATVLLLSTLNAYGASVDQAASFSDTLFTTVRLGQTTIPELASSLAQVTGTAANVGVSFDELSAAVAALTAAGLPTSQAITAIKATLTNLLKPSKEAQETAQKLGIEFGVQAVQSKGLAGVLQDVIKATGGSKEEMLKLFGSSEAVNAIFTLTGTAAEKFAIAIEEMGNKAGATQAAFEKMVNNIDLQTQKLKNNLNVTLIQVGNEILDTFGDNIGSLSGVFAALGDSVKAGAFDDIFNLLNSFGDNVSLTLDSIAQNLEAAFKNVDFDNLIKALSNLGDSVGELFGALLGDIDLSTVEGLTAGLQQAVNVITVLLNVTSGIISVFEPIFSAIGEAGQRVGETAESAQVAGGKFLGVMKLLANFGTVLGGALTIIEQSGTDVARVFDLLAGSIKLLVNGAQVAFDGIALAATKTAQSINQGLAAVTFGDTSDYFKNQATSLFQLGEAIQANLVKNSKEAREGLDQVGAAFGLIEQAADKAGNSTGGVNQNIIDASKSINEAYSQAQKDIEALGQDTAGLGISTEELAEAAKKYGDNFTVADGKIVQTLDNINNATKTANGSLAGLQTTTANLPAVYDEAGNKLNNFSDGLSGISTRYKKVEEVTKKAREESEKFLTEMEKIASNERIKLIEANVEFNIAKLEADSKKVETIFKSLDEKFKSTGEVIAAALGTLGDFKGIGRGDLAFQTLTEQLEKENKIRFEAHEQQKELVAKEIALLNKKINFFGEGGTGLIQIEATNLEPHLEAIWYELMKVIQLRANEDGAEFLLGI